MSPPQSVPPLSALRSLEHQPAHITITPPTPSPDGYKSHAPLPRRPSSSLSRTSREFSQTRTHLDVLDGDARAEGRGLSLTEKNRIWRRVMNYVLIDALLLVFAIAILMLARPTIDSRHRHLLKFPTSFQDLQDLSKLLTDISAKQPYRVAVTWFILYLIFQAFTLPGSMYLSFFAGAIWPTYTVALPACCISVASGATLCYFFSAQFGSIVLNLDVSPPIMDEIALPADPVDLEHAMQRRAPTSRFGTFLRLAYARLPFTTTRSIIGRSRTWSDVFEYFLWSFQQVVASYKAKTQAAIEDNTVWSFLLFLRFAPVVPPHWVLNFVAPHLGIGVFMFWATTAIGAMGGSILHVTIGAGLKDMTSSKDFHLISVRNGLGCAAILGALAIPLIISRRKQQQLERALEAEAD